MSRDRADTLSGILFGGGGRRLFESLAANLDVQSFLGARLGDMASSEELLTLFIDTVGMVAAARALARGACLSRVCDTRRENTTTCLRLQWRRPSTHLPPPADPCSMHASSRFHLFFPNPSFSPSLHAPPPSH